VAAHLVKEPEFEIPRENLPPGFAESVEHTPEQIAVPRPAATIVLIREGTGGPEVLLLRRVRSSGFVPGAWVFPGGRVDREDAGPELVARLSGLSAEDAAARLGLSAGADPPALAYYIAAVREAFEETGILVGRGDAGAPRSAAEDPEVRALRERVLEDEGSFPSVLDLLRSRIDGAAIEYIAHWITPQVEPRRYDTRFFAAAVPAGIESLHHTREMSDAVWITPADALRRNREGALPMVFPTIKTLAALEPFGSSRDALEDFRRRDVAPILPRLVMTPTGIRIELPER
jgi:8-oxo-dGTP pyrophosphatase MutT (NUDIX family)